METPREQLNPAGESVVNKPAMKEMLERQKIAPEDYPLIEQLAECPKNLFLEFHNFFSFGRERVVDQLAGLLRQAEGKDPDRQKFLALYLELARKYDWAVCWNVNTAFEKRL